MFRRGGRSRAGVSSPLGVWDEGGTHASTEGISRKGKALQQSFSKSFANPIQSALLVRGCYVR